MKYSNIEYATMCLSNYIKNKHNVYEFKVHYHELVQDGFFYVYIEVITDNDILMELLDISKLVFTKILGNINCEESNIRKMISFTIDGSGININILNVFDILE